MDFQRIISSGESEAVEFKQSFNDEVIETIVAFANTSGGSVYLGISNNGTGGIHWKRVHATMGQLNKK